MHALSCFISKCPWCACKFDCWRKFLILKFVVLSLWKCSFWDHEERLLRHIFFQQVFKRWNLWIYNPYFYFTHRDITIINIHVYNTGFVYVHHMFWLVYTCIYIMFGYHQTWKGNSIPRILDSRHPLQWISNLWNHSKYLNQMLLRTCFFLCCFIVMFF